MKEFTYTIVAEKERQGRVVSRDILLRVGETSYMLSVGTPAFINQIRETNKRYAEEFQEDDNILPMDDVNDLNQVIERLKEMPLDLVSSYLVEQEEEED